MFLYNITIKTDWPVHDAWLAWMLDTHIPEILGTGCFSSHKLLRLLQVDEEDGATYAIQYYADSKALYNLYMAQYAAGFRKKEAERWGSAMLCFDTLMQVVN